jgi:hypothetical protein
MSKMAHFTSGRDGFGFITRPQPLRDLPSQSTPPPFLLQTLPSSEIELSLNSSVDTEICDRCFRIIQGIRYKCSTCPNFNLCETCVDRIEKDTKISVEISFVENCGTENELTTQISSSNDFKNCGSLSPYDHDPEHLFLRLPQSIQESK